MGWGGHESIFEAGEGEGGGALGGVGQGGEAGGGGAVEGVSIFLIHGGFGEGEGGEGGEVGGADEVEEDTEGRGDFCGVGVMFEGEADGSHEDGAGLHAGAAGEGHGPDVEVELADARVVEDAAGTCGGGAELVVGIAVEEPGGIGGDGGGALSGADDPGSFAALGLGDEEVARGEAEFIELAGAVFGEVLEILDGADEGGVAPGHEGDGAVGEVGRQEAGAGEPFAGEGEAARGAATAEEDAVAGRKSVGDSGGEFGNLGSFGEEAGEGGDIHGLEGAEGGGEVVLGEVGEVGGEGVEGFGVERAELVVGGEGEEFVGGVGGGHGGKAECRIKNAECKGK